MRVIQIPTNRPRMRVDQPDIVFETIEAKYEYVAQEAIRRHEKGQPILIGTTSILQSEDVAKYLKKYGLKYPIVKCENG